MKNLLLSAMALGTVMTLLSSTSFADNDKSGNFVRGAKAWANTCSRCHNVRDPKEFSDTEWETIMLHMRQRALLDGQDARDILKFLQSSN